MSQKVETKLLCDFAHGSEASASDTLTVGFEGSAFEVDVCQDHYAHIVGVLHEVSEFGRLIGGAAPASVRSVVGVPAPAHVVRAWARSRGRRVGSKGSLPADLVAAYSRWELSQKGGKATVRTHRAA